MLQLLLIIMGCILGGFLLAGLPGGIVFLLSSPVLWLFFGPNILEKLPSHTIWPIAILLTIVTPVGIIPAHFISRWMPVYPKLVFTISLVLWGISWSVVLVGRAMKESGDTN